MQIAIVDDDKKILDEIKNYITEFMTENEQNYELHLFLSGEELVSSGQTFDVAFIDIEMKGMNGLVCAKYVQDKNENAIILIVTTYHQYLDDAMEINVYRYLPKPIEKERFLLSLSAATNKYFQIAQPVVFNNEDGVMKISSADILYLYINNRNVTLCTRQGELETRKNMEWWKKNLNPSLFSQVHKSYIVNLRYVVGFDKSTVTLLSQGKTYKVFCSRRYYINFKKDFYAYLRGTNVQSGGGITYDSFLLFSYVSVRKHHLLYFLRKLLQPQARAGLLGLQGSCCVPCRVCGKLCNKFYQRSVC